MQLNASEGLLYAIAEYCSSRLDDYVLVNKIRGDEIQRSILTKKMKNVFQYVVIFILVKILLFSFKKKFDSNNYVILQYEFV